MTHTRHLNELWKQAEEESDPIAATRKPGELEKLGRYAGNRDYDAPNDEDAAATWQNNRQTVDEVLNDARKRLPEFLEKRRMELQSTQARSHGGAEPPLEKTPDRKPPERTAMNICEICQAAAEGERASDIPEFRIATTRREYSVQGKPARLHDVCAECAKVFDQRLREATAAGHAARTAGRRNGSDAYPDGSLAQEAYSNG